MLEPRPTASFFLPSLGGGGAEMHLLRVLNAGRWEALQPRLLLARHGGAYENRLSKYVPLKHLLPRSIKSSTLSMALSWMPLRRTLKREPPAIVCSLLHHSSVVLDAAIPPGEKRPVFIVGLQNNVGRDLDLNHSTAARWYQGRVKAMLSRADHFVALSQGVADDFCDRFPQKRGKVAVIYNAGFDDATVARSREAISVPRARTKQEFLLVTCGRLTRQKNHALLLRALALARRDAHVRLWILGKGELASELEALARELKITDAVDFLGFQTNPYAYMARADAFVLSSEWEGFGNVIVEAMAIGVPVISTACPFGPSEIIQHRRNGILVPTMDVDRLAESIVELSKNRELGRQLATDGKIRAEAFRADKIAAAYEQLFESLAGMKTRAMIDIDRQ